VRSAESGFLPRTRRRRPSAAIAAQQIAGEDVLLVDDVFTTGATVTECTRVLRRAGADRVFVATVARVLKAEATWATPEDVEGPRASKAYA